MKTVKYKEKEGFKHDAYYSALFNATYMWFAINGKDFDTKPSDDFFFDESSVRCAIIEMDTAIDASHYEDNTYYKDILIELNKLLEVFKTK